MRARMMWMVVLAVAIIAAACGDSKSSLLPTAPSALPTSVANVDAGTGEAGYGATASGNGNGRQPSANTDAAEKIQFEGLIDAKGDNSILVNGQLVAVTTATVIRHGGTLLQFADLRERDRVHVTAKRIGAALEATELKLQNPGDGELEPPPPPPDPPQVVSVMALDAEAFEAGGVNGVDTGAFQLTRTGTQAQLDASLTVSLTIGGTAGAGDYVSIALTATFQGGAATTDVEVRPIADTVPESPESVELTLAAGEGYSVGTPSTATVMIADLAPPFVNVTVLDGVAAEPVGTTTNFGTLQLSRTGDVSKSLTVTIEFSGTAKFGTSAVLDRDYALSPQTPSATFTFTMAANQAALLFSVQPVADSIVEGEETVILTALPGAGYAVGTSGTVRILGQ